jgi:hypothetical protein
MNDTCEQSYSPLFFLLICRSRDLEDLDENADLLGNLGDEEGLEGLLPPVPEDGWGADPGSGGHSTATRPAKRPGLPLRISSKV